MELDWLALHRVTRQHASDGRLHAQDVAVGPRPRLAAETLSHGAHAAGRPPVTAARTHWADGVERERHL